MASRKNKKSLIPLDHSLRPHLILSKPGLVLSQRLTREEEKSLAIKYYTEKDIESAKKLIMANLWLVIKLAKEYKKSAQDLADLVQEGTIGLIEAVRNFNPFKGVRFPTYAVFWIKAYIIKYILDNFRLVKLGTNQTERKLFFNLGKNLKNENEGSDQNKAIKKLADSLGVSEEKILEVKHRMNFREVSLNEQVGGDSNGRSYEQSIPDTSVDIENEVFKKEFLEQIKKSLELFARSLPERDREVFMKRLINENKSTLQELSDDLGISIERVRQIENKIKESLKQFLLDRFREELMVE